MILPIVISLLAEMAATCEMDSPSTGLAEAWRAPTTASVALSMPRLSAMGLAPAATLFMPSR